MLNEETTKKLKDYGVALEEAFMQSHTLKGVAANPGINPLYKVTSDLVEYLRVGNVENADEKLEKITAEYNKACDMIRSL